MVCGCDRIRLEVTTLLLVQWMHPLGLEHVRLLSQQCMPCSLASALGHASTGSAMKHLRNVVCAVQVSAALNPENEAAKAFQECVLIRHPRHGV